MYSFCVYPCTLLKVSYHDLSVHVHVSDVFPKTERSLDREVGGRSELYPFFLYSYFLEFFILCKAPNVFIRLFTLLYFAVAVHRTVDEGL